MYDPDFQPYVSMAPPSKVLQWKQTLTERKRLDTTPKYPKRCKEKYQKNLFRLSFKPDLANCGRLTKIDFTHWRQRLSTTRNVFYWSTGRAMHLGWTWAFKCGWRYKMRITACVYINTWRVCQTRVHRSLIGILARHSFSLFLTGIRLSPKQARRVNKGHLITSKTMDDYRNSPTIKFCADLFPAHRCPSAIKFKVRLGCASVNWSNVLLISKAYFPANKMNWM